MFSKTRSVYSIAIKGLHRTALVYKAPKNQLKNCIWVTSGVKAKNENVMMTTEAQKLRVPIAPMTS